MDINRYYVPKKPRKLNNEEREKRHKAATSRFTNGNMRLPTPQAFFERQRKFKESDRKVMMKYATKKVVKHNLKIRRKELKEKQQKQIDELKSRIYGTTLPNIKVPAKKDEEENNKDTEEVKKEAGDLEDRETHDGVEFNKLKAAVTTENDHDINISVLKNFFELKDPKRVNEVEDILAANKGREAELFDEIAKEYKVIKVNPREKARDTIMNNNRNSFKAATSSFVEGDVMDAPAVVDKDHRAGLRPSSLVFPNQKMKKIPSSGTLLGKGSVISIDSIMTLNEDVEDVKEFEKALDKEIKAKKYQGEYVTSIKERGGQWWVNKTPPKVHPSQRRRNTMLDALRNGEVPLSL